jgi:hypothetical protein
MPIPDSSPGGFVYNLQESPHDDDSIINDTLELFYDIPSGTVAGRGVNNGVPYTVSMVPSSGTTYVTANAGDLNTGTSGVTATAAEINRVADDSVRLVTVGGTSLAVTQALHSGKIILLDHGAATSTVTLPAASGSGAVFRFIVAATNTNNHVITVTGNDVIKGSVVILDNDSTAETAYAASGTDDTLTLNSTTTGGQIGDWVEFVDFANDTYAVRGFLVVPAGSDIADPFSGT